MNEVPVASLPSPIYEPGLLQISHKFSYLRRHDSIRIIPLSFREHHCEIDFQCQQDADRDAVAKRVPRVSPDRYLSHLSLALRTGRSPRSGATTRLKPLMPRAYVEHPDKVKTASARNGPPRAHFFGKYFTPTRV